MGEDIAPLSAVAQRLLKRTGAFTLAALCMAGCSGGSGNTVSTPPTGQTANINLVTYADPWQLALPRWRDIKNISYAQAFHTQYNYARAQVTLTYSRQPAVPYFLGHIKASGLKPNFAYQLKLAGKPIHGDRGTGTTDSYIEVDSHQKNGKPIPHTFAGSSVNGDDWTNQQLGYAGRWWDDTAPPSTNLNDNYYLTNYPAHTLYGYIFIGDFVTDEFGKADVDITGNHSYHITWQDSQGGNKNTVAGTFPVQSLTAPYYGYPAAMPASSVKLWYEWESGRSHTVKLPAGTYHCRLLVTEEAFHGEGGIDGGWWQTVLATEAQGDQNPENDIVFTISK